GSRPLVIAAAFITLLTAAGACATSATSQVDSSWDVVLLGQVDFCQVCQFGPSPQVRYTRVLAGPRPGNRTEGQLGLAAVDTRFLPQGGVPIYRSQQEEIVFLKKVPAPEGGDVYRVVDIKQATPENLSAVG